MVPQSVEGRLTRPSRRCGRGIFEPVSRIACPQPFILLVVACGGAAAPVVPPPMAPEPPPAPVPAVIDARAYERGNGVPRDYRKGAMLHRERCGRGCGPVEACETYFAMATEWRGTLVGHDAIDVAPLLCDRGDSVACSIANVVGARDVPIDLAAITARCEQGNARACADWLVMAPPSAQPERARWRAEERACLGADAMSRCVTRLLAVWKQCEADAGQPCIQSLTPHDGGHDDHAAVREVWAKVTQACADGDAVACEAVPGRAVPLTARCEAGDFSACRRLEDDPAAGPAASKALCEAGHRDSCDLPEFDTSVIKDRSIAQMQCDDGDQAACAEVARHALPQCPR